ncbi:hypothetical protein [Achromobacter insolitus]|uniref:hypothetical protein n=1 Tax=Achromobacter insolitus TaxID=217204 RepID=UPI0028A6FBFE|nr:hypothetical protein [Achromobacter insolitus]
MSKPTTAASSEEVRPDSINPLSDDYINRFIREHGYDSTEVVIARLWQWIGLNGGENSVTLLMYEAHKALSKLRAPVSDIRKGFELTYAADADDPACASDLSHFTNGWRACIMSQVRAPVADERQGDIAAGLQDSAYCAGLQRGFMLGNHNDNDGLRQALESRDGYVKTIKDARDARASAPVAGEAEIMAIVRDQCPDFDATHEGPSEDDMISIARTLLARYAAPQASEAVRDAGIAASEEVVLPPLPEALALQPGQLGHTDQTLDYFARAAILADRQHRADEVAYIARLRAALILARDSHGVTLLTDPPQNAWKARGVGDVIRAALSAQPGAQTPLKEENA